ncbi:MAG: SGNH/GDSL hydrolase family protein [Eubacteriales bacterium]
MINILCFGDSNTYGYNPSNKARYMRQERWTGVLQQDLGQEYYVIEEGLNGRTILYDDPIEGDKCGKKHLPMLLASHIPLDFIIVMLGTNDLKTRFGSSSADIMLGMESIIRIIKDMKACAKPENILILAPAPLNNEMDPYLKYMFGDPMHKSMEMTDRYRDLAKNENTYFMSVGDMTQVSELDGVHLSLDGHKMLGLKIAELLKQIFETK